MGAGARVFEFMELQPRVPLHAGHTLPKNDICGVIRFEDVTFAYPTREEQAVLKNLSLELPAGKVTALCGLSGAGQLIRSIAEPHYGPCREVKEQARSIIEPQYGPCREVFFLTILVFSHREVHCSCTLGTFL